MDADTGKPSQQFRAAWQAAADAMSEWSRRISQATHEAMDKIEPAVRAAVDAGRSAMTGEWRNCQCRCTEAHPADAGVCDGRAVMTRAVAGADVSLCAPCAVAQGVAEMKLLAQVSEGAGMKTAPARWLPVPGPSQGPRRLTQSQEPEHLPG